MAFWMNASHSLAALALRRPLVATASASVEHGLHRSQIILHQGSGRVRATEHLPRDTRRVHERRHGLAEHERELRAPDDFYIPEKESEEKEA